MSDDYEAHIKTIEELIECGKTSFENVSLDDAGLDALAFALRALAQYKVDQVALSKAVERLHVLEGDSSLDRPANARALHAMAKRKVYKDWEWEQHENDGCFVVTPPLLEKVLLDKGEWAVGYFKTLGVSDPWEHFSDQIVRYAQAHGASWKRQFEKKVQQWWDNNVVGANA